MRQSARYNIHIIYMGTSLLGKKHSLLFLGVIIGLFCIVQWMPPHFFRPFQSVLVTITIPFENLLSWMAFETRSVMTFATSLSQLKEENERLHREQAEHLSQRAMLSHVLQENELLRRELDLSHQSSYRLITGAVIARSATGQRSTLRINRGSQQGIEMGMPVVSGGTLLIGVVEHVSLLASEVRLLSHAETRIAVKADEIPGELLLRGDRGVGIVLELARPSDKLKNGSIVMTTGMQERIPGGLLVGTVDSVRPSADQLFQQAVIVPPIRADKLRFVSIIIDA